MQWYAYRWTIEEFHRVLKQGYRIEARPFERRGTFKVMIAMAMLTAARILALTKRARVTSNQPATLVFSEDEERVVRAFACTQGRSARTARMLEEAVYWIARLEGYLGRSCDGPPGWIVLWTGFQHLHERLEGWRMLQDFKDWKT